MRYAPSKPSKPRRNRGKSIRELLDRIRADTKPTDRVGGVLLASGRDPTDWAVRIAQRTARFDRAPSRWSHAAIVLEWSGRSRIDTAMGVEVSLTPAGGQTHRPETNGVTAFSLTDYCDSDRYRDVAFATVVGLDRAARDRIVDAAMNPNTARTRYPLYEALGPWLHHVYSPAGCQNPLEAGIAHPGAAFCEMAYEAGGLDLTPGAVGPNVCPEMLWSTFRYWHESLPRDKGKVVVWTTARPNEIHVDRRYVAESVEASLEGHRPRR